jgi:hypothetical protein
VDKLDKLDVMDSGLGAGQIVKEQSSLPELAANIVIRFLGLAPGLFYFCRIY